MFKFVPPPPTSVVLSRASDPESMMADESVTTGEANKTKTVCDDSDDDESEDKWLVPNDKSNYLILVFYHIARINLSIHDSNHIGGVMVRVLTLSVVDHGFEPIKLVFLVSSLST